MSIHLFGRSTVAALLLCAACSERDALVGNGARTNESPNGSARSAEPKVTEPEVKDAYARDSALAVEPRDEDSTGSRHPKKSAR